ncbi:MAG: PDZ domain-containing protein [Acidobacteriaceae bacterium]|nr:PDZ domain-containing protein [Acidobacteriaceae bacterium]
MLRSAFAVLVVLAGSAGCQGIADPFLVVPQLRPGGSYIGVNLSDIDSDRAKTLRLDHEAGTEVTRVQENSPAEKAGIKAGDVLLSYNGENILGAQQLGRLVWETPPGRHVKMQYWRDGKPGLLTVVTATRPEINFDMPQMRQQMNDLRNQMRNMEIAAVPAPLIAWRNRELGVECEPLNDQMADFFGVKEGALIRYVDKGSPADKAGLRTGDVVTSINGRTLSGPRDLSGFLREQGSAAALTLGVVRNRKHLSVTVARPEE